MSNELRASVDLDIKDDVHAKPSLSKLIDQTKSENQFFNKTNNTMEKAKAKKADAKSQTSTKVQVIKGRLGQDVEMKVTEASRE